MKSELESANQASISNEPHVTPMEWSEAAIRLLQGVVYHDDGDNLWECVLRFATPLRDYFAKIGLLLIIDEGDAMAYLRQIDDAERPAEVAAFPRLFRRSPLSYEVTLLCVLVRDELRQFEENDVQNERCMIAQADLLAIWQAFFPATEDEVKLNRSLTTALRKLEEFKFVKLFEKEPATWEIRRIVKARLPLDTLEQLRASLIQELEQRNLSAEQPSGQGREWDEGNDE